MRVIAALGAALVAFRHGGRLATRIDSFGRHPSAEVKSLVSRSALPTEADPTAGRDAFRASPVRPEARGRIHRPRQWGMQQHGAVECRLCGHTAEHGAGAGAAG
jgi:hypothetical protein